MIVVEAEVNDGAGELPLELGLDCVARRAALRLLFRTPVERALKLNCRKLPADLTDRRSRPLLALVVVVDGTPRYCSLSFTAGVVVLVVALDLVALADTALTVGASRMVDCLMWGGGKDDAFPDARAGLP